MVDALLVNEIRERFGSSILTQDNRATAEPIYLVQQRKRFYGVDPDYGDEYEWIHCDDCTIPDSEETARLDRLESEPPYVVPKEWSKSYYIDTWVAEQPFFLESGAEAYIVANRHNLCDPRIYVESAYQNPEWIFLRELLKRVAAGQVTP